MSLCQNTFFKSPEEDPLKGILFHFQGFLKLPHLTLPLPVFSCHHCYTQAALPSTSTSTWHMIHNMATSWQNNSPS